MDGGFKERKGYEPGYLIASEYIAPALYLR